MDASNNFLVRSETVTRPKAWDSSDFFAEHTVSYCPDKREASRVMLPRAEAINLVAWLLGALKPTDEELGNMMFAVTTQLSIEGKIGDTP